MDISFIIVNYKSERYLERCLLSLKENLSKIAYEVIIVNNDSSPLADFFDAEKIHVINHCKNEGFAKACNLGASRATGKILFFLNPDTQLLTSNINDILQIFKNEKHTGVVGARLMTDEEKIQKWSAGQALTLWNVIRNNFGCGVDKKIWKSDVSVETGWVSGASLAIDKSLFESISGFDENFFMYFEDADLCKRVIEKGKTVLLMPSVKVLHFGGQSADDKSQQKNQYYASQDYYFKKHFGIFQLHSLRLLRSISLIFKK